jgi:L-threonylcarbamoyladenylate synthase
LKIDENQLDTAITSLCDGGVIAYPTEAVWGLGCDPYNELAVSKILRLKARSIEKGLILVGSHIEQFEQLLLPLSDEKRTKLTSSWPGPTTWLIEDHNQIIPRWIKGSFSSVAVRVSEHEVVKQLCSRFGSPIVSTSLNPAGKAPALSSIESFNYFADEIDFILEGQLGRSLSPSRIISLDSNQIIR